MVLASRENDGCRSSLSPNVSYTLRAGSLASTMKILVYGPMRRLYRTCVPSGDQAGLLSKNGSCVRFLISLVFRLNVKMSVTPSFTPSNATTSGSGDHEGDSSSSIPGIDTCFTSLP